MKPKRQREIIYWYLMFEVEAFQLISGNLPFQAKHGLCHLINHVTNTHMSNLPELEAQRPKNYYGSTTYWFAPGFVEPRLRALSKAIDLCHSSSKR